MGKKKSSLFLEILHRELSTDARHDRFLEEVEKNVYLYAERCTM